MFASDQGSTPNNVYVDDVFSTYLHTGTGVTQAITNGIDLAGKGGLVWIKKRNNIYSHALADTTRGVNKLLATDSGIASFTEANSVTAFNSNGFSVSSSQYTGASPETYVSWTFRKSSRFFDIVTYTGNGANRTIAHSLGQVPGMIIVKNTSGANQNWQVYHRSLANTEYLVLNTNAQKATGATRWNSTTATAADFSVGTDATVNANAVTYIAYLFAHDAAADGIIQCGTFTTDGSGNATINLGWEAQFVIAKAVTNFSENWTMLDAMRGLSVGSNNGFLEANTNLTDRFIAKFYSAEATGFKAVGRAINTVYVYVAIRRPNKPPTTGTQIYNAKNVTTLYNTSVTGIGFPPDWVRYSNRTGLYQSDVYDRLRGQGNILATHTSAIEGTDAQGLLSFDMDGFSNGTRFGTTPDSWTTHCFKRARGVFDVVCYDGTGSATTVSHSLATTPELIIVKRRSTTASDWWVYHSAVGATKYLVLNSNAIPTTSTTAWNDAAPGSSSFSIGTGSQVNASSNTYVAYLFASLSGISSVGNYTGNGGTVNTNGTSQTINCGFSTGARFVLIKRTDATGDWFLFDSTRGIVASNDPYLLLNSTAAEVTTVDAVDADNSGFIVNQTSGTNLNVTNATYIYLAIA